MVRLVCPRPDSANALDLFQFAAASTSLTPEMLYVMLSKSKSSLSDRRSMGHSHWGDVAYTNALLVQLNSRRRMKRVLHGTDGLVMSLDTQLRFAARSRASKTGEPEVLARYDSAASSRVGIGNHSGDVVTARGDADISNVSWFILSSVTFNSTSALTRTHTLCQPRFQT
jgi:hypothetical protein